MNPTIFADLRNVFADLFPKEPSIRRIVDDAGLDGRKVDFGSSAINIWHSVLAEAEKVDQVEALFRAVEHEGYGNNRAFRDARQAYHHSQGKAVGVELDANPPNPQAHRALWQQRLPALLLGILLLGFAGCETYRAFNGFNAPSTPTSAISNAGSTEETSAKETSTPIDLPTATLPAALPPPTSTATASATATDAAPLTNTPQPAMPAPQPTATVPTPPLCDFAFLVLDDESEEPIRRATVAVFVGAKQETGPTDSTGYYLAHLPCTNERDVEARVRVSADGYQPYNRSVFLSNETTEILLEREATPTTTPTLTFTPIPTLQPRVTATPTPSPCTATVISTTGATQISLRESATGTATSRRIPVGATVVVISSYDNGSAYQIIYQEKNYRGWLPADNLELTPGCIY